MFVQVIQGRVTGPNQLDTGEPEFLDLCQPWLYTP
jgi:hypothetical protein